MCVEENEEHSGMCWENMSAAQEEIGSAKYYTENGGREELCERRSLQLDNVFGDV